MELTTWIYAVQIRQLKREDLPALEWEGSFTHFRRIYADAYERARNGKSVLWIAELPEAGVIGQLFVQLICDRPELADGASRGYIYAFRVRPAYQSCGLGTLLMDTAEEDLLRRGYAYVTLNVARDNLRAQKLYRRRGYRVVAPEPGRWSYQDENGIWHQVEEPAWRLEKKLFTPGARA